MRSNWRRPTAFAFLVCLTLSGKVQAQDASVRLEGGRKSGTYLQTGIAQGQGGLASHASLTRWDVALFGTDYDLVSAKLEFESYFGGTLFQLSGFSLGYRKDGLRRAEPGHMLSGGVFRDLDFKLFALKLGTGLEWGMPSLNFDRTEFRYDNDGTVRYLHTYMQRNADVPFVGTRIDGVVYPFIEVSLVQRPSIFLFETGMRIGMPSFNFDDFEISPTGQLLHQSERKRVLVPYLFADIGIRLF
jgi:hypothetical protein